LALATALLVFSVSPENYWFRYIILLYAVVLFYVFILISRQKTHTKNAFLMIAAIISLSQLFIVKSEAIAQRGLPNTIRNVLTYPNYEAGLNSPLQGLKDPLHSKRRVLCLTTEDPSRLLVGNYVAALHPRARIRYADGRRFSRRLSRVKQFAGKYDLVLFTGKDLITEDRLSALISEVRDYQIQHIKSPIPYEADALVFFR
jgi:hypothetical protein